MHPCIKFRSSKGLEKTLTFKILENDMFYIEMHQPI